MAKIDCRGPLGNAYCIMAAAIRLAKQLNRDIKSNIDLDVFKDYLESSSSYEEVKQKIVLYFKDYFIDIEYIEDKEGEYGGY